MSLIKVLRVFLKSVIFLLLLILYLILTSFNYIIFQNKDRKLKNATVISSCINKVSLFVLGVKIEVVDNNSRFSSDKNYLIVSNHLCYLDIFMLASLFRIIFVASIDGIENDLLLGTVTKLGGGIFVERRNRSTVLTDIGKISERLSEGYNVALFPETTTSNGERVLDFKSSFFSAAINTQVDILPVCIRYRQVNKEKITSVNRDLVYFYGGISFFDHFFRLLTLKSLEVEITMLKTIENKQNSNRKELCQKTYDAIFQHYMN